MRDRRAPDQARPDCHSPILGHDLVVFVAEPPQRVANYVVAVVEVEPRWPEVGITGTYAATGEGDWLATVRKPQGPQRDRATQGVQESERLATLERGGFRLQRPLRRRVLSVPDVVGGDDRAEALGYDAEGRLGAGRASRANAALCRSGHGSCHRPGGLPSLLVCWLVN